MSWRITLIAIVALAVSVPDAAWAHGRGGGRSGAKTGSGLRHAHRHHSFSGAFVFGSPWWYRGGYAYAPVAPYPEPPVYVERFPGEPTPGTSERIFCPNRGAYYPDATECPGGWQRVIGD
jgi:hypothetical protein